MPNTEPITPEALRETAKILDEAPWGGSVPAEENAVGDLRAAAEEIEVLRAALLIAAEEGIVQASFGEDYPANLVSLWVRAWMGQAEDQIAKEKETPE